jgi:hypothetical protein
MNIFCVRRVYMKRNIQLIVVLLLTLTVIGIARNSPVWASEQPSGAAQPLFKIDIAESGSYTIGGLCQFNAVYTGSGSNATVAVDVPADVSRRVPNSYKDQLYLAGCHIVHSVMGEITREMSLAYGSWEVCFGDRPGEQLMIYYYLDNPETGSAIWQPLTTTVKDGYVCAPANYTGVYAPGGNRIITTDTDNNQQFGFAGGTVRPPSPGNRGKIKKPGTYNVGSVASFIVKYNSPQFSNVVHVESDVDVSANVPFPDDAGLLYLPGVHILNYKTNKLITDVTPADGNWKICFAAIPNSDTTIYFYYANGETTDSVTSVWAPLETTIENGMACAPAYHTGVYAPASK